MPRSFETPDSVRAAFLKTFENAGVPFDMHDLAVTQRLCRLVVLFQSMGLAQSDAISAAVGVLVADKLSAVCNDLNIIAGRLG